MLLVKKLNHVISVNQFLDKSYLSSLFKLAESFELKDSKRKLPKPLKNLIFATIFYEPSTRTRLSFEAAILKLGGNLVSTENAGAFSSAIKGETLEDSIKIISSYTNAIVLRHFAKGAAQKASVVSSVPIINAGDGTGEHPTQALLDLYTIKKEKKRLDNLKIALVGDLLYGRTVHSLIPLLCLYKNTEIYLVSPRKLGLPKEYKNLLLEKNVKFKQFSTLNKILARVDVLYITRIQKERFKNLNEYKKLKNSFIIDDKILKKLSKNAIIMHPLPRVNEISKVVDKDKRAVYFKQAKNGLYVRMALLANLKY